MLFLYLLLLPVSTVTTHRILGIDPGLNHTGFGVIDAAGDKLTLVTAGFWGRPAVRHLPAPPSIT